MYTKCNMNFRIVMDLNDSKSITIFNLIVWGFFSITEFHLYKYMQVHLVEAFFFIMNNLMFQLI